LVTLVTKPPSAVVTIKLTRYHLRVVALNWAT